MEEIIGDYALILLAQVLGVCVVMAAIVTTIIALLMYLFL